LNQQNDLNQSQFYKFFSLQNNIENNNNISSSTQQFTTDSAPTPPTTTITAEVTDTKESNDQSDNNQIKTTNKKRRIKAALPEEATRIMTNWFETNLLKPYPSDDQRRQMAQLGQIHEDQVRAWFANKRNRSGISKQRKEILNLKTQNETEHQQKNESSIIKLDSTIQQDNNNNNNNYQNPVNIDKKWQQIMVIENDQQKVELNLNDNTSL
jgi:hypothetical protein